MMNPMLLIIHSKVTRFIDLIASAKYSGGRCLIAVSNSLGSSPIILNDNSVEHLFVKVSTKFSKFIVGAAYKTQDFSFNQFIKHCENVEFLASRFHSFKLIMFVD